MLDADNGGAATLGEVEDAEKRLRELQALTDTALLRLDVEEFLSELLRRTCAIVDADTATVLLLDESSDELVATATCGLEEEVRRGVRVPLTESFAGRIASRKRPIALDRVDATTVANPLLWARGIRVLLGVPLLVADDLIGVLHVGRLRRERFSARDRELLEVVAERVAGATQGRRLALERAAAALLERSLLPGRLPSYPGLELAARYITPEDPAVGGDWYDVFTGRSQTLWVVMGDVAGHGLPAAVVMGRVRSALRAYALLSDSPTTVLELTDGKVEHFEIGSMVTAICATSVPPYDQWRIAAAGHPPPIVAAPGGPGSLVELPVGPPLGVASTTRRAATTVPLPEGAVMVVYTDGLIERRGEPLDAGLDRVRRELRAEAPADVCRRLLRRVVGAGGPTDDVAIMALRRGAG